MTLEKILEISKWLDIIGIPTVFGLTSWCVIACIKFFKKLDILSKAQKAQMRSQLLNQYYMYKAIGSIAQEDLDDWINQYDAYHELVGPNGVLDKRKEELISMPSVPSKHN